MGLWLIPRLFTVTVLGSKWLTSAVERFDSSDRFNLKRLLHRPIKIGKPRLKGGPGGDMAPGPQDLKFLGGL